ncbi:hypothetical protein M513_09905 [Trichuris suis]|uniref:Uncharacterized protein n=1 Tax=Trichuris suis TaxID=68888 RepID=A0A085LW37_9BILA|nr:hypothetical protein M513_09905 [Trichuris suis]
MPCPSMEPDLQHAHVRRTATCKKFQISDKIKDDKNLTSSILPLITGLVLLSYQDTPVRLAVSLFTAFVDTPVPVFSVNFRISGQHYLTEEYCSWGVL